MHAGCQSACHCIILLVSCLSSPFILPYLANNGVGARDPLERLRILVVFAELVLNGWDEVAYRVKGSTANAFAIFLRHWTSAFGLPRNFVPLRR